MSSVPGRYIPQVVFDIFDTFMNIVADPVLLQLGLTLPETIFGHYDDIRTRVNAYTNSTYKVLDISQGLVWIRKYGVDEFGATISKAGPGSRVLTYVNPTTGTETDITGNVYCMIGANQPTTDIKWDEAIRPGMAGWAKYEGTSAENNEAQASLYITAMPAAWRRTVRGRQALVMLQAMQTTEALLAAQAKALEALLS